MKKGYFPNPAQRATPAWLEARVRRLSNMLEMPLSFSRQNPGDGARYQVLDASGSHRISGTLKAGDMDMWLTGAIDVLGMLELKKRGSL